MRRLLALALLALGSGLLDSFIGSLSAGDTRRSEHVWDWRAYPGGRYVGLFKDGLQVGCWRPELGGYRPLHEDNTWGDVAEPPVPLPDLEWMTTHGQALGAARPPCRCNARCNCDRSCNCDRPGKCSPACPCGRALPDGDGREGCQVESDGTLNFGVARRDPPRRPRYSVCGRPATRDHVLALLGEGGSVPDDSSLWSLTVIGPPPSRQPVLTDLDTAPALSGWKGWLKVKAYDPGHWAVARCGFECDGNPTIYVQDATGKVLHHQNDYQGGAQALATALRQADPNYQPSQDPDLRRPRSPLFLPAGLPWSVPVFLVLAGSAIWFSRRKS